MSGPALIRRLLLTLLIASAGACAGDGCEGATPAEGEFPEARRMNRPLKLRLTSQGADFLASNAVAILRGVFGGDPSGAVRLDLAALDMGLLDIEELGEGGVNLRDLVLLLRVPEDQVELELLEQPGRFRLKVDTAHISIASGALGFSDGEDGLSVACGLGDGVDADDPNNKRVGSITVELMIEPFVNEFERIDARVEVLELTIHDWGILFPLDCELEECTDGCAECRVACPILSGSAAVAAAVLDKARDDLAELVREQIRERIDEILAELGAQALDVEIDVATLLGRLLPSAKSATPIRAMLSNTIGGIGVTRDPGGLGLDVRMDAGADAEGHRCVTPPPGEPAHVFGPPPGPETSADPVHFVLSFAGGALDAAVWAAYKSGLLCVSLTSDEIAQISDGALALTAGGLESLLPGISSLAGADAPILVTLEPGFGAEDFPLVRVEQQDDGKAQLVVALKKVGLSLHARIDGRFARVIGLEATAEIRAGLIALPDASLEVTLDGVDIQDLRVSYEEVLPGRDLAQLAGFITGAAAGSLLSDVSFPIAAPEALGELLGTAMTLNVRSIRADGANGDWIAARVALEHAPQADSAIAAPRTDVRVAQWKTPPGTPPTLKVPAADPAGRELEYQVRVDHLPWTSFRQGRLPDLAGPHWLIRGEHVVRVRARYVGSPRSLDLDGWVGRFHVAPKVKWTSLAPSAPAPAASDTRLLLAPWLRRGGGPVTGGLAALPLALMTGCEDGKEAAGGCTTTADCPARQACSRGECVPAPPCETPQDCCPGQVCLTGLCQDPAACDAEHCSGPTVQCQGDWCVRLACTEDSACPAGLRCVGGRCVQGVPCDGKCTAGQACHAITAECRPTPQACAGGAMTCDVGALLHVIDPDGGLLGGGCGWEEASCECVPSPPLPPGDIGRWGSPAWLDGKAVAAAYDGTYADLVWLEWDGAGAPSIIESVAGVPEGVPAVAAEDGYRGGVAHPGPRAGRHAALLISDGAPLIAHRNDTARSLDVATGGRGAWAVHTVDDDGDVGHGVAGAILADGMPALAYAAKVGDGYSVRFVRATGARPGDASEWGRPVDLATLPAEPALDMATGGDTTAIAWAADGKIGVLTSTGGGGFVSTSLVEADAGPDVALAIAADGAVAVVYNDPAVGIVRLHLDGDASDLDDGARGGAIRRVGAWPAAAYDAGGTLRIAYQDPFENDLLTVTPGQAGRPLETAGAVGFHNALLLDGPGGASYVYTALLGFDSAGRSLAGPRLIALP